MKIVHVSTYENGGAANACIRLHKAMLSNGIDSNLLILAANPSRGIPACSSMNEQLSLMQKLRSKILWRLRSNQIEGLSKGNDVFSVLTHKVNICDHPLIRQADIVNLHWVSDFVDLGALAKSGKKVVWTLHDMNPFTGGCHYSEGCENFMSTCQECPQLLSTSKEGLIHKFHSYKAQTYRQMEPTVVAPSVWLQNCAKMSSTFSGLHIEHIPYGLDQTIFRPIQKSKARSHFGIDISKKVVLFVADGVSNKRKGFSLLVEAIEGLSNDNVQLVAIGALDQPVPGVSSLGFIREEAEMAMAYSMADVFVIPSLEDNLPNTVIESLSCGTPVVGFEVGGIVDMVENGVNGRLVERGSIRGLTESIQQLVDAENDITTMSVNALRMAEKTFAENIQVDRYMSLYKTILG